MMNTNSPRGSKRARVSAVFFRNLVARLLGARVTGVVIRNSMVMEDIRSSMAMVVVMEAVAMVRRLPRSMGWVLVERPRWVRAVVCWGGRC